MLEALALAGVMAVAAAAVPKAPESPPPPDLLEFIGEWSDDEAQAVLDEQAPGQAAHSGANRGTAQPEEFDDEQPRESRHER